MYSSANSKEITKTDLAPSILTMVAVLATQLTEVQFTLLNLN